MLDDNRTLRGPVTAIFEPWGLGDALIAAAAAREMSDKFTLFCSSKWHPLIRAATKGALDLQAAEGTYTYRGSPQSLSQFFTAFLNKVSVLRTSNTNLSEVLSIRGDPRDWLLIKRTFPGIKTHMTGWLCFLAKQISVIDWLYRLGLLKVHNRYSKWEELVGLPKGSIEKSYLSKRIVNVPKKPGLHFIIHLGAQWRSKQYPFVNELRVLLSERGYKITLVAGPRDPLPAGITEEMVIRPTPDDLIPLLQSAHWVISNDSGPMHLSAFIGVKTVVIALVSNIEEWLPPGAIAICSNRMPKGYRPMRDYATDKTLEGWPEPGIIIQTILKGEVRLNR